MVYRYMDFSSHFELENKTRFYENCLKNAFLKIKSTNFGKIGSLFPFKDGQDQTNCHFAERILRRTGIFFQAIFSKMTFFHL